MAAGRVIIALALTAATGIMLLGNVRCASHPDSPATTPLARETPSPAETDPPEAPRATTDSADIAVPTVDPAPAPAPGPGPGPAEPLADTIIPVTIDGRTFNLELAADAESRTRGLMDRESIPDDGGMIFVFPDVAMRSFWMKNCLTDMDILFLDGSGRVTAMHEMTIEPPQRPGETEWQYEWRLPGYSSLRPAQFAIELAPGTLRQLQVGRNDLIPLDLPDLKGRAR
jgi:uncharacterized membrane protein (UPF0127 family)